MAPTPLTAYGRLRINYTAMGHPHEFRCFLAPFDTSTGDFAGTPEGSQDVEDLAQDLSLVLAGTYYTTQELTFGEWVAEIRLPDGVFQPVLSQAIDTTGFVKGAPGGFFDPVTQMTTIYRTSDYKIVRFVTFAQPRHEIVKYISLSAIPIDAFELWAYTLGHNGGIVGRNGSPLTTFVSQAQDGNDKLRRQYGQI